MTFLLKIDMKKRYRVKDTREFQRIMNQKRFFACKSFVIYIKEKTQDQARIGISVGKKIGNAVIRNKTKRQTRMMLQEYFDLSGNFDAILLIRVGYHQHSFQTNKKELENLLKKVKMYKHKTL